MINIKITIYSPCICCIQILLHPLRLGSWSAGSGGFQAADGREGAKCNLSLQWSVWRFGLIIWNIWVLDNIHYIYMDRYIYIWIVIYIYTSLYIYINTIMYTTMHICIVMYIYIHIHTRHFGIPQFWGSPLEHFWTPQFHHPAVPSHYRAAKPLWLLVQGWTKSNMLGNVKSIPLIYSVGLRESVNPISVYVHSNFGSFFLSFFSCLGPP